MSWKTRKHKLTKAGRYCYTPLVIAIWLIPWPFVLCKVAASAPETPDGSRTVEHAIIVGACVIVFWGPFWAGAWACLRKKFFVN